MASVQIHPRHVAIPPSDAEPDAGFWTSICQNAGFDGFPRDSPSVVARRGIRALSLGCLYVVSPLRCLLQVEKFKCKTEAGVAREDRTQKVITRESKTRTLWKKGVFAELNEA